MALATLWVGTPCTAVPDGVPPVRYTAEAHAGTEEAGLANVCSRLRRAFSLSHGPITMGDSGYVMRLAAYHCRVAAESVSVDARYRIEVGPQRVPVSVPLVGGLIGVRERVVPETAYLLSRSNEIHAVLMEPGVSDVALTFEVAVQREGCGAQARFAAAPAVIRELTVNAGPDVAGDVSVPGISMQEGPRGSEGVLDDRSDVVLQWAVTRDETEAAGIPVAPIATCHGDHIACYGEDALEIRSTFALRIDPPGIRHANLWLPPGMKLSEVAGDGIRDWRRMGETALRIGFAAPRQGPCRFRLHGAVSLSALPAEHSLALPYVRTRAHQSGDLVLVARGVQADVLNVSAMHRANVPGAIPRVDSAFPGASNIVATFTATGATNAGARVLLKPLRSRIRMETAAELVVSADRTSLMHDATLHVSDRALCELEVIRQPVGRVVSVEGPGVAGWTTGVSDNRHETILVRFDKPVFGKTTLSIRVDMDYDALPAGQCLSGFRIPGATLTRGRLRTYAGEGVAIRTTSTAGLMALPQSTSPVVHAVDSVAPASTYALRTQGWRLDLSAAPRSPELSVETFTLLEAAEGAFRGSMLCHCLVEHAPLTGLTIDLPADWRNETVDGGAVSRFWVEKDVMHIVFNGEVKGTEALVVSFETATDETTGVARVSGPVVRDAVSQSGVLAVVGSRDLAVVERSRADLVTIAPDRIPLRYALLPGENPVLAYRHRSARWNLSLGARRRRVVDIPDILVDFARIRSRVSPGGRTVTRAIYTVRNSGRNYLRLGLPDGVVLLGAFVDGREAVTHIEDGDFLLRLPRHGPERAFDVDVRCLTKQRAARARWPFLAARVRGPSIDAPVRAAAWAVCPRSAMRAIRRDAMPGFDCGRPAGSSSSIQRSLSSLSVFAWGWIAALSACSVIGTACYAKMPRSWRPVAGVTLLALAVAAGYVSETAGRTDALVQCQINMRRMEDAVDEVMSMSNYVNVASVTTESVQEFLPEGRMPRCPSGGTYTSVSAADHLRCSVHGGSARSSDARACLAVERRPELPFGAEHEWTTTGVLLPAGARPWVRILAVDPTFVRRLLLVAAVALLVVGMGLATWRTPGERRRRVAVAVFVAASALLAVRLDVFGRFIAGLPLLVAATCAVLLHVVRPAVANVRCAGTAALCMLLFVSVGTGPARADRTRTTAPFVGGLCVQETTLDVRMTGDSAVVDARIEALVTPPTRDSTAARDDAIPECVLLPAATAVRSIDVKSPDGRGRIARSDHGLLLRGREPGRYRVRARYVVPVRREANVSRLTLPLTAAPVRTVNVRVDRENVVVRSPGAVAVSSEVCRGATSAVVIPGAGEAVELELMGDDSATERGRLPLQVEVRTDARVSTSGVLLNTVLSYRPAWGAVDHVAVFLPRDLEVVRVMGDHVRGPRCRSEADGTELGVVLKQPVAEAFDVRLQCRAPVSPLPHDANLPYPVPLNVNRAAGTLTVSAEPGIALRLRPGEGLRRKPRTCAGEDEGDAVSYGFTFDRPDIGLNYSAEQARPRVHTEVSGLVDVRDDTVDLSMTCKNEIRGAGIAELLAELPLEAELLGATADDAAQCYVRERQGTRWLVVRLRKACPERLTYRLTLRWPRTADAVMRLMPARPVGVESCRGMLGVRLAESEYGFYRVIRGLVPCPAARFGDAAPRVSRAFRFNSADWVLEMKAARPRPWVEALALHHVRFLSDDVQAVSEFRYDVQRGSVRQLAVAFGPEASDVRLLSGDARLEPASNDVYRVVWDVPVTGKRIASFGYALRRSGVGTNTTVVLPHAAAVDRESGYVALAAEDDSDIRLTTESFGTALTECPSPPVFGSDLDALFAKAHLCYRYTGRPAPLVVAAHRRQGARTVACRATEAKAISVLSNTGLLLTRVVYDLSGRGRPLLSATLPPQGRLLSCFVADEPVPVVVEGERIAVPIGDLRANETVKRVRLTYMARVGSDTASAVSRGRIPGRLRLALARLSVPVDDLHWSLYLPAGQRYRQVGGTVDLTGPQGQIVALDGPPGRRDWHHSSEVRAGMAGKLKMGVRALRLNGDARGVHALWRRAAAATGAAHDVDALRAFNDLVDVVAARFRPLPLSGDAYEDALSAALRTGGANAESAKGVPITPSIIAARKRFRAGLRSSPDSRAAQFRFALPVSGRHYEAHATYVLPEDAPPCLEFAVARIAAWDWRQLLIWGVLSGGVCLLLVGFRRHRALPAVLGLILLAAAYAGAGWL